jgi:hypothetical protein
LHQVNVNEGLIVGSILFRQRLASLFTKLSANGQLKRRKTAAGELLEQHIWRFRPRDTRGKIKIRSASRWRVLSRQLMIFPEGGSGGKSAGNVGAESSQRENFRFSLVDFWKISLLSTSSARPRGETFE